MQQKTMQCTPLQDSEQCPSCGNKLVELHAGAVCNRCGYNPGCCDLL